MGIADLGGLVERQSWLDPASATLQPAIKGAFAAGGAAGQTLANALYGTWLGHPLHPVLTSVPLGAWTVAVALDCLDECLDRHDLARGADTAVAVGIAGALGAATSGLADWQHESGGSARVGLVHGLLNLSATTLFTASLWLRGRNARRAAQSFALLGLGVAAGAGYLGGHMVFGQQLGVDHTAGLTLPTDWVPVLADGELPEGELRGANANDVPIVLARQHGQINALVATCSHRGGPLAEGELRDGGVVCPWHSSCFALEDGRVVDGPATFPQPCLETRVNAGQIEVRLPSRG